MSGNVRIIFVRESVWQSYARDAGTFALAIALILPGHFLGIGALEWIGAFIFFFMTFMTVRRGVGNVRHFTPDQARAYLDAEFPPPGDGHD